MKWHSSGPIALMPGPVTLSDEQQEAYQEMEQFARKRVPGTFYTLHGYAGSGKTTVLSAFANKHQDAIVCALAGKAADVLRRKMNRPAQTLHSAFYQMKGKETNDDGETTNIFFSPVHEKGSLRGKLFLFDEVSMIPAHMAREILETGCTIIACGDPGQLPPVQGEQFFTKPDFTLKKIHRQALDSPIIRQAHFVRFNKPYRNDGPDFQVKARLDAWDLPMSDVVLTWERNFADAMNAKKRRSLGIVKNYPQPGEPVLCLLNNADFGIYNGATYTLTKEFADGDNGIWLDLNNKSTYVSPVTFQGMRNTVPRGIEPASRFSFGYAMTVHKAQGSEWDRVLLFDNYQANHSYTNWAYTGITRAAKSIIICKTNVRIPK